MWNIWFISSSYQHLRPVSPVWRDVTDLKTKSIQESGTRPGVIRGHWRVISNQKNCPQHFQGNNWDSQDWRYIWSQEWRDMERWPSCQFWNVLLSGWVLQTLFSVILKPSNWSGTDQQQRKYGFHYSSPIVVLNCGVKVSSESQRGIIWCAGIRSWQYSQWLPSDNLSPGEDIQTVTTVITVITISWYISHPHYHVTTVRNKDRTICICNSGFNVTPHPRWWFLSIPSQSFL